ncbi:UPF0042 nucleotide-binding protein [Sinosporangium album]|uniref:UPF0042 nucleotide-binding protein n=1 Tax=Sinosporangium album TaxID=504805 RepID=A0A1G8L6A7_9ACTN|nr:RNase adapter RapZ [Sinosporangium album]SDI51273.1 UPF0042 nucleotide-binding protein [Sinosporangium album]
MIRLISFGYLHSTPPLADRVEDVRAKLRDPARARNVLDLDGYHPRVQEIVRTTPGAEELLGELERYALSRSTATLAIGCAGGKHRACALIELLAGRLKARGRDVEVEHRHAHLPRVLKDS